MGGGSEVRQGRLYSRLTCAQKRQRCKADSWPAKLLSLWLVLSPPSTSSSNGQALHPVWCSLQAFSDTKTSKKSEKLFPQKSLVRKSRESKCIFHGSRKHRKPLSRGWENMDSRITEKINPHSCFTQIKNAHSRVTKKSIGDPQIRVRPSRVPKKNSSSVSMVLCGSSMPLALLGGVGSSNG